MTPDHWQAIEELYHAALELTGEARAELLRRAEPKIRSVVEAMLAQEGSAVLDRPAWEHADASIEARPLALAAGAKLGPYEVVSVIGSGGMGKVYRAKDTRLNREVAIKASNAQFSQRFEREAKTIAALNHPNICQIYDVGANYLVMELVDGGPIISHDRPRPLAADEAVALAMQIAAALEAAHSKGIIHRDLKPANILATGGVVKLLDFGLAKQSGPSSTEDHTQTMGLTQAGMIMGTPAYMSPEQAEGKSADERSDIFSFGVVFYEMLAGRRAFPGGSPAAVLGAVVHNEPEPLAAPPALAAIVRKCLAKSPDARFQTATELRQALEAVSIEATSLLNRRTLAAIVGLLAIAGLALFFFLRAPRADGEINSIAVLPLEIKSADPDAEYISDGITESVNNSLARLPELKVIPHSVALRYKGKAAEIQKVGAQLGVQVVLTGRIVQRGEDLTVAVELDDIGKGKQLWGDRYNRKVADSLAIQSEIAREVSQRLRGHLSKDDQRKLARGSTENSDAYQLYLKGKYHTSKFTKDEFRKGIDYFYQALAKDPNYGLAYSGLAYYYILQDDWYLAPSDSASRAKAAAQKALEIDDSNADAHLALAMESHWYEWDWAAADREFKRALELSPKNGDAYGLYAWYLAAMGRKDEAVATAAQGQRADPLSLSGNFAPGSISVFTRQWGKATEQLRGAIDLDATYWLDYIFLGRAYEQQNRLPDALAAFENARKLDQDHAEIWSALGHAYAVSGNRTEAQKVLDRLQNSKSLSYLAPYNVAIVYAGMGSRDQTFAWLDRAYQQRSYYLPVYLTTDARLDFLHADPRFLDLRRRIGLPE
jgi:serine/threonine protein kinase/Tfp pilus assembly protein PilF